MKYSITDDQGNILSDARVRYENVDEGEIADLAQRVANVLGEAVRVVTELDSGDCEFAIVRPDVAIRCDTIWGPCACGATH